MKYHFRLGMDIRAYGFVYIEAESADEARQLLTAEYVANNFEPFGSSSDLDYTTPRDIAILDGTCEDEDGEDVEFNGDEDVADGPWVCDRDKARHEQAIALLCDTLEAWEGEEESVKDEHADHIAKLQTFIDEQQKGGAS